MAAIIQASVTSLAWVCAASFGVPVVPPVWKRAARSVADGRLAHEAVVWLLRRQRGQVADPHAVDRAQLRLRRAAPGRAQGEQCLDPGLDGRASRALSQTSGARSGPAATRTRAPDLRSSSAMCSPDRPLLIGAAMPASSAARVAVMSSSQFGASRATPSVRRTPRAWNTLA